MTQNTTTITKYTKCDNKTELYTNKVTKQTQYHLNNIFVLSRFKS